MSKELTTVTENSVGYATAGKNMAAAFAEELDGLTPVFDRIKIPSGGGLAYEVPGENVDSSDMVKDFKAVILYHHPVHAFYKEKYTGGNTPPNCGSYDGHFGTEYETGEVKECRDCPNNKFGSAENNAKACKQKRRLYILREGEVLPLLLSLPTTSLTDFSKFLMRLLAKGKKSNTIVTKFTLKKEQNSKGIAYSQAVLSVDRDLNETELTVIEAMSEQVKALAAKITETVDDD